MQQIVFHNNEYTELKKILSEHHPENICVVHTKNSYKVSGSETFIQNLIGSGYAEFTDFEPNPKHEDLKKGLKLIHSGKFTMVVAIGGGTAIDLAKMMKALAYKEYKLESIITGEEKITEMGIPLLAIPTTSGTGSEATRFSVMYIGKKKYSISANAIYPEYVYLDPAFSMSASSYLTACTGLDALCQAIEALWSVNATEESSTYATVAISLAHKNLHQAVVNNSADAKAAMQTSAHLAGKAINIAKTTAPHALSYAFTSFYNIPHGHAVALSLPFFTIYNYNVTDADCMDSRGVNYVKNQIEIFLNIFNTNIDRVETDLNDFFSKIGIEIKIPKLIESFDQKDIVENINMERVSNNPRKVTNEALSQFFTSAI